MTFLFGSRSKNIIACLVLALAISSEYCFVEGGVPPINRNLDRQEPLSPITLEEVLSGAYAHREFAGDWVPGSDNLIRYWKPDSIVVYDVETGEEDVVVYLQNITDNLPPNSPLFTVTFSNDGNFALVAHGRSPSKPQTYIPTAKYAILDVNTRQLSELAPPDSHGRDLQYAGWTSAGNGIVFVHKYNVYYKADPQPETAVRVITQDGIDDDQGMAIYNGVPDLAYYTMFLSQNSVWMSKEGRSLAFLKLDVSKVEVFQWTVYGEPGSEDSIYPKYPTLRYAKAGTPNPIPDVYVVSLNDPNSTPMNVTFPDTVEEDRHIIAMVTWASETELMIATMNRGQTRSRWHLCPIDTRVCRQFYTYELDHGWIDMNTPVISDNGQMFAFVRSVKQAGSFGPESYKHIVRFDADGSSIALTEGRLSVKSILGWDEPNNKIYFSGSLWNGTHDDPTETQIYYVGHDGPDSTPTCITCGLQNSFNATCRENSAVFSPNFERFIHRCNGPDIPETTTRLTQDSRTVDHPGPTSINNSNIHEALAKKAVPITREYALPVGVGKNFTARARLVLPLDFDESKKYPLLVYVYGGPGQQNIMRNYGMANILPGITWEHSLVSDKNIAVAIIDGRGTMSSSSDHLFEVHRKLGTAEIEDQITVTKHLVDTLPFIDANKTAIHGVSYGGFAATKVLETDVENVFKCGIAAAPVTNWMHYFSFYSERYLELPTEDDNLVGYQNSDTTSKQAVQNLRNKQFMLIHGNADDNVHYQNAMLLVRRLEEEDIFFHQLSYPDEDHEIQLKAHFFHSMERFLFDHCFKE